MAPLNLRAFLGSSPDIDSEMTQQWTNPGDIFSLLLLIGGDIVQKALAQLVGFEIRFSKNRSVLLTPVAFSFGWVAYAFAAIKDIVGDGSLMPEADFDGQVINCSSGYIRTNHSWILGRVLRDWQKRHEVDRNKISIRIDIFEGINKPAADPDVLWWSGWGVILLQHLLAMVPWILYGDWTKFFVTVCGTIGALVTGMMPQWKKEKWATRRLEGGKEKITGLTRGNGHANVMIFIHDGKDAWDVEAMASASGESRPETRWIMVALMVWWTLLLITCSGLHENTWYLIGVGGLGMIQNLIVAGAKREPGAFNFHIKHIATIESYRKKREDVVEPKDSNPAPNPDPLHSIGNVMGALMELENRYPGAGSCLVNIFFPGKVEYEDGQFPFNREKKFWKWAYDTMKDRKKKAQGERAARRSENSKGTVTVQSS